MNQWVMAIVRRLSNLNARFVLSFRVRRSERECTVDVRRPRFLPRVGALSINISVKPCKARSRLYRIRFLQPNIRLKAHAEVYTVYSFAQLESNLKTMKSAAGKRHPGKKRKHRRRKKQTAATPRGLWEVDEKRAQGTLL